MTTPTQSIANLRGRFAPSPTGPLHMGSLVAALGSYLNIHHANGNWLIRIDDIDQPRCVAGIDQQILDTLAAHGLESDQPVRYSNQHLDDYGSAYKRLEDLGLLFPCSCSRQTVRQSQSISGNTLVYNGCCRQGVNPKDALRSFRIRVPEHPIEFKDYLQGVQIDHLNETVGDFVIRRIDGQFAYQLATVVDDHLQQITEVVRGSDLLPSTGRQILLQNSLGYSQPSYFHLPTVVDRDHEKFSKQQGAPAIDPNLASQNLLLALQLLQQSPPETLGLESPTNIIQWGIQHWQTAALTMKHRVILSTKS